MNQWQLLLMLEVYLSNQQGEIEPDLYAIFPAKSKASKQEIIHHSVWILKQQANRILDKNFKIIGVGYAFPGPFDYENGISYIDGVDKFDHSMV